MKKALSILVGLIVLLLAAALIGPSFVDWNQYKPEIVSQIKAMTGRDLSIDGEIDLAVLPAPTLSANQLRLANIEGATEPDMVTLDALRVRVAFLPLLSGEVQVETIALVTPVIHLEVLPDGRPNWDFAPARESAAEPEGVPGAPAAGEPGGRARAVSLDHFRIENGTLTYRDRTSGTFEKLERLNAEIAARSLAGPVKARGDVVARGVPVAFEAAAGEIEAGRPIALNIALTFTDAEAEARFAGDLSAPEPEGRVTGTLEAEGKDLARLVRTGLDAAAGDGGPPAVPGLLAQKFSLESRIEGSADGLDLNDIAIQLGDTKITGAVGVVPGTPLQVDVALSANQIDLDKWLKAMAAEKGTVAPKAERGAPEAGGEPEAPAPAATAFALPADIKGSLVLDIGTMVYKGGVIRQGKLNAGLDQGRLKLERLSAFLPGGSDISLAGTLAPREGRPAFSGHVEAVSDDLRGIFDWLEIDISRVPADRLHRFSFTSRIDGTPAQVTLSGINLTLDTSQMTGGVAVALRERPSFGVRLDVNRFNLDAYMPPPAPAGGEAKKSNAGLPAQIIPTKPKPVAPGLAVLNSFDVNLDAHIGSLTLRGMQVDDVRAVGVLHQGNLKVTEAGFGNLAGTSVKLFGTAAGFGETPALDADFDVRVADLAQAMRLGEGEPPAFADRLGALELQGNAKGSLGELALDTSLDAAGGRVDVDGTVGVAADAISYDLALGAAHPDLAGLVRVFAPDYDPAARDLGGLSLEGRLKGDPVTAELTGFKGKVGPVSLSGQAKAKLNGVRPQITANLDASEIIVDLFLPPKQTQKARVPPRAGIQKVAATAPAARPASERWSREPLNLSGLRAVDAQVELAAAALAYGKYRVAQPQTAIALTDGTLEVRRLTGTMFDGAFDMKAKLVAGDLPALSGTVSVADANIQKALFEAGNINVASGRLNFDMEAAGKGRSPYEIVSALAGKGRFDVADGMMHGFDLSAVSERLSNLDSAIDFLKLLQSSMSGGTTAFQKLDGTFVIEKGVAKSDDIHLVAKAGEGKAAGLVDLPAWRIDMGAEFYLTEHPEAPPFGMRVTGPLDKPQRKFETERMQAFLVQRGVGTLLKKMMPEKEGAPATAPGATEETAPAAPESPLDKLLDKVLPRKEQPATQQQPTAPQTQPAPETETAPAQEPAPQPEAEAQPQPQPAPEAPAAEAEPQPEGAPEQPAAEPAPPPEDQTPEEKLKDLLKGLKL